MPTKLQKMINDFLSKKPTKKGTRKKKTGNGCKTRRGRGLTLPGMRPFNAF